MWRLAWTASLFKETCLLTLMQVRGTTAWRAQHERGQECTLSSGTVVKWDHGPRAGGVGGVCVACDGVVVRVRGWLLGSALWDSRRLCFAPCSSSLNRCSSTANNHKTVHCRDRQGQVGCGVKWELSGHQHQVTGQDWHQLNSLGFHSVTFAYLDILPYGPNESSLHELSFGELVVYFVFAGNTGATSELFLLLLLLHSVLLFAPLYLFSFFLALHLHHYVSGIAEPTTSRCENHGNRAIRMRCIGILTSGVMECDKKWIQMRG